MTVTEIPAAEQIVAKRETAALFMARRRELRLVLTPVYPTYGPGGQKTGETRGRTIQFRDGSFRVPAAGSVALENGDEMDAAELVSLLESHKRYLDVDEGFWKVDPTAPAPTGEEIDAIVRAATALDEATLARIVEQERESWCRQAILDPAQNGLDAVRRVKAEAAAQAPVQEAEPKAKPGPKPKTEPQEG